MEIRVCTTLEWSEQDWDTYVSGFNEVFKRNFLREYFEHKYLSVTGGCSYHALLYNDTKEVVGGCTVIPCIYNRMRETFLNGLAVDVFIREAYRIDPLMLRRMYKKLKKMLEEKGVVAVMAVPNATAYPYWKNVVKWKDVGKLNYWVFPVKLGNILEKYKRLNFISSWYAYSNYFLSGVFSFLSCRAQDYIYSINAQDEFLRHRYDNDFVLYHQEGIFYAYRIVNEEGIKTVYLINATQNGKRSLKAFRLAIKNILKQDIDLILYIGKIGFFQTLFLKVPEKFEPKLLPLTCDLVSEDNQYKDMYDIRLWDFGLMNYDVR